MLNCCIICNGNDFDVILDYKKNKVVTSDNKIIGSSFLLQQCRKCSHIQKKIDSTFLSNIELIYKNYQAYHLDDGKEEEKTTLDNKSISRSQIILKNIKTIISSSGKILDIGTGTGVFLKEFSSLYSWELYAQDVNVNDKNNVAVLKKFQKFYIVGKDKLNEDYFDIISAIHVFEHILDVNKFLVDVKKSLHKSGFLLLQLPNIDENIFDIFTIDHVSHFNKYMINYLLKKHFKHIYIPQQQIPREITVIATNSPINALNEQDINNLDIDIKSKVNNLIDYLNDIDKKMAIFGTSPAALLCAALLNVKIEYFIDENKNKQNKKLYGYDIISPSIADNNIEILFPYSNDILNIMQKKYPTLNFIYLESLI